MSIDHSPGSDLQRPSDHPVLAFVYESMRNYLHDVNMVREQSEWRESKVSPHKRSFKLLKTSQANGSNGLRVSKEPICDFLVRECSCSY